ncbi:MAG: response regulator transcription factor [Kiritimatiellae bacterium]|nr:response regulator transcription factor [Kiritimatiellia bacterium]
MSNQLILIVDGDSDSQERLIGLMRQEGYKAIAANDGREGIRTARSGKPDLILVNTDSPDTDGMAFCQSIRFIPATETLPVICLSSNADELRIVDVLDAGADDYIVKPYSQRELLARIKAQLRRRAKSEPADNSLMFGDLVIDEERYEVRIEDETVAFTRKEFELLLLLARHRGRVLSREFILDRIWGPEFLGETRTVAVHIRHLRRKLGQHADMVQSVRGVGYRFDQLK